MKRAMKPRMGIYQISVCYKPLPRAADAIGESDARVHVAKPYHVARRPRNKEMGRDISRIERDVKEYAPKRFGTCVDDLVISRSDVVVMVVGTVLLETVSLCLRNGMPYESGIPKIGNWKGLTSS